MNKINLVVIGTGMYTCGRGTAGYGTILPAVFEWARMGKLGTLYIVGKRPAGLKVLAKKLRELQNVTGLDLPYVKFPKNNLADPCAYVKAVQQIPEPAAVIIATPDNLHYPMAKEVIKQHRHLLVVKPLTPTVKENYRLISLAEKNKVYAAVEFHKRYDWANLKLYEVIKSKRIGLPLYFHIEYSQQITIPLNYFRDWVNTTNIFQYLGVHYADLIFFLTGAKPIRLMAIGQKKVLPALGIDTYDAIQVMIEWLVADTKSRFVTTMLTNWVDPKTTTAMSYQSIKLVGTQGRFESDQKNRGIQIIDEYGVEDFNPYFCQPYVNINSGKSYRGYGVDSIIQFFTDVTDIYTGRKKIADLETLRPTFRNSLVSTAIVAAVNISLTQNNCWVEFDDKLYPYV